MTADRKPIHRETFPAQTIGEFAPCRAAEAWCEAHGISVGHGQRGAPRGLLIGNFDIQKWRNLDSDERAALHGVMRGDMRNGPVIVDLYVEVPPCT